ncbi:hypothetical protein [Nonomuraea sp. NPDC049695]|uniref:hypothetical protein n=1 Tax=Nonomuraea sp. NPDC049695 TaxID=3154734 RepID=UPI00343BEB33
MGRTRTAVCRPARQAPGAAGSLGYTVAGRRKRIPADLPERQRARLREMHEYYTFMVRRLDALLGEYKAFRAR